MESTPTPRHVNAAWRADAECRVSRLRACLQVAAEAGASPRRTAAAEKQLAVVDEVLNRRATTVEKWKGADIERAWVHLHEVQVTLVELAEPKDLRGELPRAYAVAKRVLEPDDPELTRLAALVDATDLDDAGRDVLVNAMRSAHAAKAEQHRQLRSFRNTLFSAAGVLFFFAIILGAVGLFSPASMSLCFGGTICPTGAVGPTGGDVFMVELLGVFGAMIVGAVAIRRMRGTSTPYAVLLASLLVKLPTGALTAVGGLLLLKAGFVVGVGPMETAAIAAYAVLFGASQQAVTKLLDRQTQTVLDSVGTKDRSDGKDRDKEHVAVQPS
jgi:hypothetical protein